MTGARADVVTQVCDAVGGVEGDVRAVVAAAVDQLAPLESDAERAAVAAAAVARLAGLDAIEPLLADPDVDEVLVNAGGELWVERRGTLERVGTMTPDALDVAVHRILAGTGRRLDRLHPVIDARLADGSRVCAVAPPVAVDGTTVAIRRHRRRRYGLDSFAADEVVDIIRGLVDGRSNVVVSGPTSSGKTTLLAAALATLPPTERLVVIEDTAEIALDEHHLVRLEARPPAPDGVTPITMVDLVRAALRLRPDRLVVGEFRGDEAVAVVQALGTGHDGSWATCHANSATDALERLATLVLQAAPTWPMAAIRTQISRSVDAIVHLSRGDGSRCVDEIVVRMAHEWHTIVRGGRVVAGTEVS